MRVWMIPLAASLGCKQSGELNIEHLSAMENATNGLVLSEDGQQGHAGMTGTTCSFDTLNGWLINDYNLPGQRDQIDDRRDTEVVGVSNEGVHVIAQDEVGWGWGWQGEQSKPDIRQEGVVAARMTDAGVVTLFEHDGCKLRFPTGDVRELDASLCAPGVDVVARRSDATVYVATGDAVWRVRPGMAERLADGVSAMAFNQEDLLFGIGNGREEVEVIDEAGGPNWSFDLPGTPTALTWLGERGLVAVMVDEGEMGGLSVFDPEGNEITHIVTPSAAQGLASSGDGSTLAVVLEDEVHFYDLYAEGEEPKERKTLGVEDQDPTFSD